jgi:hypothetical protein
MSPFTRRTFLRGAGAALALPFLESSLTRSAWASSHSAVKRLLVFYVPNGIQTQWWTPDAEGADFDIKPILTPLTHLRQRIRLVSGLRNDPAKPDGPGDHAGGTGSFLTAAHCYKTDGANIRNGISIDQRIAQAVGGDHRYASIVTASEGGGNTGGCDSGYSCAYTHNISWISETQPAARESRPRILFNRLFGGDQAGLSDAERARRNAQRSSVLDFVLDDAQRLQAKLGVSDRHKLDEYLTGVRELERQITLGVGAQCASGSAPENVADLPTKVRQMLDLIVLGLQCDLSPVVTYMLGNAGSNRPMPWLNIAEGHHSISHHQDDPDRLDMLRRIATWEMEQVAYLLDRMAATPDVDGSLLDNTLVLFSSEIEDGHRHRHTNLPVLLAGGEGLGVQQGLHQRVDPSTPIANLFVGLAHAMGVPIDSFGDSDGVLGLLA